MTMAFLIETAFRTAVGAKVDFASLLYNLQLLKGFLSLWLSFSLSLSFQPEKTSHRRSDLILYLKLDHLNHPLWHRSAIEVRLGKIRTPEWSAFFFLFPPGCGCPLSTCARRKEEQEVAAGRLDKHLVAHRENNQ